MKTLVAAALVLAAVPVAAVDRYSGFYSRDCGTHVVCDLRIEPAGRDRWRVAFAAADLRDPSNRPFCAVSTTVAIGDATVGGVEVSGIAVGKARGRPFALFDLGDGRIEVSMKGQACPGITAKGIYGAVGD